MAKELVTTRRWIPGGIINSNFWPLDYAKSEKSLYRLDFKTEKLTGESDTARSLHRGNTYIPERAALPFQAPHVKH
jgi:hypothetical protein